MTDCDGPTDGAVDEDVLEAVTYEVELEDKVKPVVRDEPSMLKGSVAWLRERKVDIYLRACCSLSVGMGG